jgi:hypothetical protein
LDIVAVEAAAEVVVEVIMQRGRPENLSAGFPSRMRLARISLRLHSSVEMVVVTLLSVEAKSEEPPEEELPYRCCCCTRY